MARSATRTSEDVDLWQLSGYTCTLFIFPLLLVLDDVDLMSFLVVSLCSTSWQYLYATLQIDAEITISILMHVLHVEKRERDIISFATIRSSFFSWNASRPIYPPTSDAAHC